MPGRRTRIIIGTALGLALAITAGRSDARAFRAWRQLGGDVSQLKTQNKELTERIAVQEKRAEALRVESQLIGRSRAAMPRGSAPALERVAHENGYIAKDETLYQLK